MRPRRLVGCWVTADLLSVLGTRLAALAVPWLVLTTTGSATKTGLVAAAELLPLVLARALAGPLIDRLGAVRSAVLADASSALVVALVPLLWVSGVLSFPALLVLVALLGTVRGPADAAKQTMLPELAAATDQPLERITGIGGTIERLATSVGLALGGVVVALVGGAEALAVTAAGFTISAVITGVALRPALARVRPPATPREGYLAAFRGGLVSLRQDRLLISVVIMLAACNGIDQAYIAVLLPAWVLEQGHGAETLGLSLAVFMAAAVLGSMIATAVAHRLPRFPVYVLCFLISGSPRFLVSAIDTSLAAVIVVLAIGGFAAGFINPILSAVIIERIPAAVRGRVLALVGAASMALLPVGGLVGGVLADVVGIGVALLITGLLYLGVTLLPVLLPSWREFGRRPITPESGQLESGSRRVGSRS